MRSSTSGPTAAGAGRRQSRRQQESTPASVRNSSCENIHSVAISSETSAPMPTTSSRPVPPKADCSFGETKLPNTPPAP
jgi:hypothetical protein